jgi:cytoskeletal protein CcmA (bactofilin family)
MGEAKIFLGQGSSFCGKLLFRETVRIDGDFEGEIHGGASLIIGATGKVRAKIEVENIAISGSLWGSVKAGGLVEILPAGRFWGDLKTRKLRIHEGAFFEGSSQMENEETAEKQEIE